MKALFLLVAWLLCAVAHAEEPVEASGKVGKVTVEGTRRIEEAAVLSNIGLRRGDTLTPEKVRRDLKSVWETGFFQDVVIEKSENDDGTVDLLFVVREKPAIREVKIEGNKKIDEDDIREVMDLRSFSVLNDAKVSDNVAQIRDLYVEKGYYLADVDVEKIEVADDQVDLRFKIQENRKVLVQRIEFHGNDHVPANKLKRFLQVKEGGFLPWLTNTGTFRREQLDADQQVVTAVFLEEGYVDVKVDPPKVYLSPDKRFIFISYNIEEGEKYDFGEVAVSGEFLPEEGLTEAAALDIATGRPVHEVQEETWREYTGRKKFLPQLNFDPRGARIASGETFKYSLIHTVGENIASLYRDQGYAFVNVVPLSEPDPDTKTVAITYDISMGEKIRIGRINITGNDPTFDKVVRREIQIDEGDLYRGSLINASRARLARLGFFDEVNISTPRGDGPDVLDLNFQVSEQPTGSFSLGMGYSNLESFVFNANVSKNNFLGLGWSMSLAVNYSRLRQQFNLSFVDPYFLDTRWSFQVNAYSIDRRFGQFQVSNGLNEFQRGGSVGVGRYLDKRDDVQLRLDYTIEDVGLTNIDPFRRRLLGGDLYRNGITSSLGLSLNIDKRNNRIFATQGVFVSFSSTLAGGFRVSKNEVLNLLGGEFNFIENRFNIRYFQPLIKNSDRLVLRVNSTIGQIISTDGRVIPFIHRYRAGGINSVRGFNWFSLGPSIRAVSSDDPDRADDRIIVGGTQTWVNNIEIEAPVIRQAGVSAVVFFDAGNTFGDPWNKGNLNPLGLRTAVGAGVRWRSPIGPLRFEYGIPLRPFEDERKSVFDFSIGSFF
ncbi:MAG: outer membrane protein assembly factor BamA [Alphaproteobacteria bacterium]|nr:outer membrane protein assembly factor BamA [Alphaproteobacteria bacterium]